MPETTAGKFASFGAGELTPTVTLINKATEPLGLDLAKLRDALQIFVDKHVQPAWGVGAKLQLAETFKPGAWAIVFYDDADQAGALGYHDLTPHGLPLAKVFVSPTLESGKKLSVTASHELAEMLVDPAINLGAQAPDGTFYAYEVCDPVEEDELDVGAEGLPMSDFVLPSWLEAFRARRSAAPTKFDALGKVSSPFEMLDGGYVLVFRNNHWTRVFGSIKKELGFAYEDYRAHRSTRREERKPRAQSRLRRVEEHVRLENQHDLDGLMSTFGETGRLRGALVRAPRRRVAAFPAGRVFAAQEAWAMSTERTGKMRMDEYPEMREHIMQEALLASRALREPLAEKHTESLQASPGFQASSYSPGVADYSLAVVDHLLEAWAGYQADKAMLMILQDPSRLVEARIACKVEGGFAAWFRVPSLNEVFVERGGEHAVRIPGGEE